MFCPARVFSSTLSSTSASVVSKDGLLLLGPVVALAYGRPVLSRHLPLRSSPAPAPRTGCGARGGLRQRLGVSLLSWCSSPCCQAALFVFSAVGPQFPVVLLGPSLVLAILYVVVVDGGLARCCVARSRSRRGSWPVSFVAVTLGADGAAGGSSTSVTLMVTTFEALPPPRSSTFTLTV